MWHFLAIAEEKTKEVAILFYHKCKFSLLSEHRDPERRYILNKGAIDDQTYTFVSYYTPKNGQSSFFQSMLRSFAPLLEDTVILEGDSNIAFDQGIDKFRSPGKRLSRPTKQSLGNAKIIFQYGLVDVWREINPTVQNYEHYLSPHNSFARIDHLFIATAKIPPVSKSFFWDSTWSDHSIVFLTLQRPLRHRCSGRCTLNESILSDPLRKSRVRFKDYFQMNDTRETTPTCLWAAHKAMIRGKLIQLASQISRARWILIKQKRSLSIFQKKTQSESTVSFYKKYQALPSQPLTSKSEKWFCWNRAWVFFCQRDKIRQVRSPGPLLSQKLRQRVARYPRIHNVLWENFTTFTKNYIVQDIQHSASWLNFSIFRSINWRFITGRNQKPSSEEVCAVIKNSNSHSVLGTDGFYVPYYKACSEKLAPYMANFFYCIKSGSSLRKLVYCSKHFSYP